MGDPEHPNAEAPIEAPITSEEMVERLERLRAAITTVDQPIRPGLPADERHAAYDRRFQAIHDAIDGWVREQLADRERFQHIVRTEQGSLYFVLEMGACVRIRRSAGTAPDGRYGRYDPQPMTRRVYFATPWLAAFMAQTAPDMSTFQRADPRSWPVRLIGTPIPVAETPAMGSIPIEVDQRSRSSLTPVEERDGSIVFTGAAPFSHHPFNPSSDTPVIGDVHVGHPIVEVIK